MTVVKGSRAAANEGEDNDEDLEDDDLDTDDDKPSKKITAETHVPIKRFKGLQREFEKLKKLADRRGELLEERDEEDATTLRDYEAETIRLRSEVKKLPTLEQQIADLTKTNGALARDKAIRQSLSAPELDLGDVIQFYDAGFFVPGDVEGDVLIAKANEFKALLAGKFQKGLQDTLSGTKPAGGSPLAAGGNANAAGMTETELSTWLMKNPNHPEYEAREEAYFTMTSAQ